MCTGPAVCRRPCFLGVLLWILHFFCLLSLNMEMSTWYLEPSPPLPSVQGAGKYSALYQRRKLNTKPPTNPVTYNGDLLQDELAQWWHKGCGSNQPKSGWIQGPHNEMEPISNVAWMVKNLRLNGPGTKGKTKCYRSAKGT